MARRGCKNCPNCDAEVGVRTKVCPSCEHQFPLSMPARPKKRKYRVINPVNVELPPPPTFKPKVSAGPPSMPKKRKSPCPMHKKYQAKLPPQCGCSTCWSVYLKKKWDLDMVLRPVAYRIRITNPNAVKQLVTELRECLRRADHSGGAHSAFVNTGKSQVQIEVQTK